MIVEQELREIAKESGATLDVGSGENEEIHVRFETFAAFGENCDIAILRLASEILDDGRFAPKLVEALRGQVELHGMKAIGESKSAA